MPTCKTSPCAVTMQYRHFLALLDLFKLKPSKESKEFGDLAMFMAQVSRLAVGTSPHPPHPAVNQAADANARRRSAAVTI